MRIVQLARLSQLTCLGHRSRCSSQVTQRASESQSIQHLGNTGLLNVALPIFAPVTSGQSSFETIGDDVVLDGLLQQNFVVAGVDTFLEDLGHHICEVSEELAEMCAQE